MAEKATIARPYAEAIFDIAKADDNLASWSDMLALIAAVAADEQMASILDNPNVEQAKVSSLFLEVCGEHLDQKGNHLVQLLIENNRMIVVGEIVALFNQLKAIHEQTMDVHVVSAFDMDAAKRSQLASALHKSLGRKVHLDVSHDPALIGGVVIHAGDRVIDGSVRGRLQQMTAALRG